VEEGCRELDSTVNIRSFIALVDWPQNIWLGD